MKCRFLALTLCAMGCSSSTTLTVNLLATGGLSPSALEGKVTVNAGGHISSQTVSFVPAALRLPSRFTVELPAQTALVTVDITGTTSYGQPIDASETTRVQPHQDTTLNFFLDGAPISPTPDAGASASDGGTGGIAVADMALDGGSADGGDGGSGDGGSTSPCGVCNAPSICCGTSCVDPTRDPNHCGSCGNVCASGLCGSAVVETMAGGSAPPLWSFNTNPAAQGGAHYDTTADDAVLTNDVDNQTGSIVYAHPIVTDAFDASFDFRITVGGFPYADGMGFLMIANNPAVANIARAVGQGGGGLGMLQPTPVGDSAILSGYGVELDTYDNDYPDGRCGESVDGDHINIDTLDACTFGSGGTGPTPVGTPQAFPLADNLWHTLVMHFAGGALSVSVRTGNTTTPLLTAVPLPGFTAGQAYYYGFSGATGGYSEHAEIRNVSLAFPTVRCL